MVDHAWACYPACNYAIGSARTGRRAFLWHWAHSTTFTSNMPFYLSKYNFLFYNSTSLYMHSRHCTDNNDCPCLSIELHIARLCFYVTITERIVGASHGKSDNLRCCIRIKCTSVLTHILENELIHRFCIQKSDVHAPRPYCHPLLLVPWIQAERGSY